MDFFNILSLISGATIIPAVSSIAVSLISKLIEKKLKKEKSLIVSIKTEDGGTKDVKIDSENYEQIIELLKEINKTESNQGGGVK